MIASSTSTYTSSQVCDEVLLFIREVYVAPLQSI